MKFVVPGLLLASLLGNVALLFRSAPAPVEKQCPECPSAESGSTTTMTTRSGSSSTAAFGSVPANEVRSEAQDRLCALGEERLRSEWGRDREKNTELLHRGLGDKDYQEKELRENAARLTGALGLTKLQADTFTKRYREKRLARVAEAKQALDHQPPDYGALAAAMRGLFADEDALARQIAGDAALQKMQAAELETRTALLGTVVVWASEPLSNVHW